MRMRVFRLKFDTRGLAGWLAGCFYSKKEAELPCLVLFGASLSASKGCVSLVYVVYCVCMCVCVVWWPHDYMPDSGGCF
jgi:hypothetical protein